MDDALSVVAIIIASVSACFVFWQTREFTKQTRLAYLPYILPIWYDADEETRHKYLALKNVGNGVAVDVHLIIRNEHVALLKESFEIYAFAPERTFPFREINLEINNRLEITGYYFDTARKKHDVEIEFEYPPKIHKNKQ